MGTSAPLLDFTVPEYNSSFPEYYYFGEDAIPCFKYNIKELASKFLPPLYSLVFIVGLLGNAAVVLILTKYKRLTSMTNIYLFNLAISDLLFLVTIPFWIHYEKQNDWVFGNAMCKLLTGLHYLGLYSEIFFIILLTVDRYVAIVHAVFAIRVRRVVLSVTTSIITWVIALLVSLPDIIFTKTQWEFTHYTCSLHFPHETARIWRKFQALKLNFLGLILPMWIMIACYTGIIRILLKRRNEKKWKAVKLIFAIMIIFFLFWTPYSITILISAFDEFIFTLDCEKSKQLDLAIQVTEVIAFTHCCVNPVIYAFIGERFQKYLSHFARNHIAVHLCRRVPSFLKDRLERASSISPPTGEHEISDEF